MLPNFYIVGAPKAGTTSLYNYLKDHKDIFMCPIKEPNFFSDKYITAQQLYYEHKNISCIEDYLKLFNNVRIEKVVGEASVSYLFYDKVAFQIKTSVPDAKIIICLRDPCERAFSHYLMDLRLGYVDISFEDIFYRRSIHPFYHLYYQQFIELGFYYKQVKRYIDVFGKKKVKILVSDDFKNNIGKVMSDVCTFLEVSPCIKNNYNERYNTYISPKNFFISSLYSSAKVRKFSRFFLPYFLIKAVKKVLFIAENKPELAHELRRDLVHLYKKDIVKTGELIRRDLSCWYRER